MRGTGVIRLSAPSGLCLSEPRISHYHKSAYDERGRIVSDTLYRRDGSVQRRVEYVYETVHEPEGELEVTCKLCFDSRGVYAGMNRTYAQGERIVRSEIYDINNQLADTIFGVMRRKK